MLDAKADTGIAYLKSLSNALHQDWKGMGGTLYTTIYDLDKGKIYVYLYHDYKHQVNFDLKDELAKGDRVLEIASLFPLNPKYERLKNYKTVFNSDLLLSIFVFCGALFVFSSLFFLISFLRNRKITPETSKKYSRVKLLLFAVDVLLLYFVIMLIRNEIIFYFPLRFIASYIPFLLFLLIFPLLWLNYKLFITKSWTTFSNCLFALNNLSYLTLLILFSYWLSYRIF